MPNGEGEKAKRAGGEEPREVAAVVDRIEDNNIAVLSLGDGKRMLDLPLSRLPEGTSDGDHLRLTFGGEPSEQTLMRAVKDRRSRAGAEDRIRELQERLSRSSGAQGKKDFKL